MRRLRTLLLLAATAAIAAVPVALASGTTTAAPAAATAPASNVGDTAATLNGSVNPNAQQTSYAFQWGPTNGYGHETKLTSAGAGTSATPVNAGLTGLSPGTTYHFRAIAISSAGTAVGSDVTFTTTGTAPTPSPAPTAVTGATSSVGQSAAKLAGTVNPKGQATTYYFEYGPTANYGYETAAGNGGSGVSDEPVSADLSSLPSGKTFHYRLVSFSAGGTALGADRTFTTTTPPTLATGSASNVQPTSATLNGTVNPRGHQASAYFQFGTSTAYGLQTPARTVGAGTSSIAVNAYVGGLIANTTYHYRIVSQSSGGTSYGADHTVKTSGPSQVPSRVSFMGRMGFVSPGRWIGVEAGCFGGDTRCAGHVTMTHDGILIGQRSFNIAAKSGGFHNIRLTSRGARMLHSNRVHRLMSVDVAVTATNGQKLSETMHLARWVWR